MLAPKERIGNNTYNLELLGAISVSSIVIHSVCVMSHLMRRMTLRIYQ